MLFNGRTRFGEISLDLPRYLPASGCAIGDGWVQGRAGEPQSIACSSFHVPWRLSIACVLELKAFVHELFMRTSPMFTRHPFHRFCFAPVRWFGRFFSRR